MVRRPAMLSRKPRTDLLTITAAFGNEKSESLQGTVWPSIEHNWLDEGLIAITQVFRTRRSRRLSRSSSRNRESARSCNEKEENGHGCGQSGMSIAPRRLYIQTPAYPSASPIPLCARPVLDGCTTPDTPSRVLFQVLPMFPSVPQTTQRVPAVVAREEGDWSRQGRRSRRGLTNPVLSLARADSIGENQTRVDRTDSF